MPKKKRKSKIKRKSSKIKKTRTKKRSSKNKVRQGIKVYKKDKRVKLFSGTVSPNKT